MPFVLFFIFGTVFLLICSSSKGDQIVRFNNFPSCRYQEEYLLFHEKLAEYRADSNRDDPIGDALEDARQELWEQGHLPSSFIAYGMSDWKHRPVARRAPMQQHEPKLMPLYYELEYFRRLDRSYGNHSMQAKFLEHRGKDIVFNEERWAEYCAELDRRFEALWLKQQPQYSYEQLPWMNASDASTIVFLNDGYIVFNPNTEEMTVCFGGRIIGRISQNTWTEWTFRRWREHAKGIAVDGLIYMRNRDTREEAREASKWMGLGEHDSSLLVVPQRLEAMLRDSVQIQLQKGAQLRLWR